MYVNVLSISFEKFILCNYVYMMSEYFTGMLILSYFSLSILGTQAHV